MNSLKIYGFNETSEAGDDVTAISVFLNRCNLNCPYCINRELLKNTKSINIEPIDFNVITQYIKDNDVKNVFISGGEPLIHETSKLIDLISTFKDLKCNVGFSTNGTYYGKLDILLNYVDYVAMDIKTPNEEIYKSLLNREELYYTIHKNVKSILDVVIKSKSLLINKKNASKHFDYQIRTTLYPRFINEQSLKEIGKYIIDGEKWILQPYRKTKDCSVEAYTHEECVSLLKIALEFTKDAEIRYV